MLDRLGHTRLGRKDHYILLAMFGALASLAVLLFDLIQEVRAKPEQTSGRVTVFILTVQCLCCLASFLGYVYRSLAGRPGPLTTLSVCSVFANLCLLLIKVFIEVLFSGYHPEDYSQSIPFEDVFVPAV